MLGILIDLFTIVGIVGLMFWLNWDFALVAVGVTPFLLFFVARFKRAVKKAQHEVRRNRPTSSPSSRKGSSRCGSSRHSAARISRRHDSER